MESAIAFLLYNFSLTLFIVGLLGAFVSIAKHAGPMSRDLVVEALIRWFVFFSIGISYLYNAVVHTVFAERAAEFIGWANSPFQLEVGFASLGFSVIGFVAFKGSWQVRLCAILGTSCFLLGAAGGHLYQMVVANNFAPGNAGPVFYTDICLPFIGWGLLYMSYPSRNKDRS